jgi:RyR domain
MEHRRWSGERLLRGWRPGARDDDRRLHPDLKPFEELDEDGWEKDRDAVRAVPGVLALAGWSIARGSCISRRSTPPHRLGERSSRRVAASLSSGGR